jgi:hypothetical protein
VRCGISYCGGRRGGNQSQGRLPTQHTVDCRKRACKAGPKGRGFGRRYDEGKCRLCHVGGEFRLQHGLGQRDITTALNIISAKMISGLALTNLAVTSLCLLVPVG